MASGRDHLRTCADCALFLAPRRLGYRRLDKCRRVTNSDLALLFGSVELFGGQSGRIDIACVKLVSIVEKKTKSVPRCHSAIY